MTTRIITNIEKRMRQKGLTQKGLALKAGLNETAVRDILKGRSKDPQLSTLRALARILSCSVEDLYQSGSRKYGVAEGQTPWPGHIGVEANDAVDDDETATIEQVHIQGANAPDVLKDGRKKKVAAHWQVPTDALVRSSDDPAQFKIVRIDDAAMAPEINKGDHVMVNIATTAPSPAGLFLLWDGVGFIVRHCELKPGAKPPRLIVRGKNANDAHEMALKDITICGRIVAKWQKI